MGDTLITVIAIFLAAILMFVFPLMSIAERNDDISQLGVQSATVEFVDNIRSTGKITQNNYTSFVQTLAATGNTYDIEMEVKILDENPGKKTAQVSGDKIGENVYYSIYTTQIEQDLKTSDMTDGIQNDSGVKRLKEGDMVYVSVKNTNSTIAQMLKNFVYSIAGNDTYQVAAQHGGVVMTNGGK